VIATPGQRYEFSSVKVLGEDKAIPPRLASDRLELDVGDPIATDQILSAEATMSLVFPFNGYPFAEVGQRDILLDSETKTGDYTLPIELGPRASFRDVRVEGDPVFSAEHVAILARYEEGDLYDVRLQDDLREALIATSLLSSVSIEPERTEETAPDGTEYVDLVVDLAEGPARAISGDVGFETGRGFTLTGRWAHRNLFPPEGAGEVTATLGTNEQGLGFLFRRSNAGRRDRSALLGLDFRNQDFEAFNARSASLVGRIAYESTPIWQKRITYAYGFELIASDETTFDPDTGEDPKNTFIIGALPAQVGYDTSDNLLDPTRGFRATLRASPEASLQGGDFDPYGRVLFDLSAYQKLYEGETDSFVLAGRTRFGSIFGIPLFEIAPSRRYYAGGGGSVRGFGFQDIGPRDTDLDPIGGRSVNEFAIEGRYRFGDFGVVAFVDSGQVYDEEIPQLSDLEFAAGFGARYYTNFGPLRFDIGFPLDPDPGVSDFGILISIGQAF
ncbi:MAG: BamA/TamA family outer membrane protein, partial [Pseudomonadota bacterium]